jgi:hypothetical protein
MSDMNEVDSSLGRFFIQGKPELGPVIGSHGHTVDQWILVIKNKASSQRQHFLTPTAFPRALSNGKWKIDHPVTFIRCQ